MRDADIRETRRTELILTWTRSSAFATTLFINISAELKPFSCRQSCKKSSTQNPQAIFSRKTDTVSKENRWGIEHKN
jgi:hypothetical protein